MKKTTVCFVSLGCPKNQIDTEIMMHEVVSAGYEITAEDISADIVIVNTCAFIESAKKEAIDNILDVAWLKKNRNLKGIICCGCLAERYRDQIFTELPEVDAVVGTGSIHNIVKAIEEVESGRKYISCEKNELLRLGGDRVLTTPEYTAYIKIAEGCDNRCSYCAIPNIRGKFRSRMIEDIVDEAIDLEALGVKELILVAQDTTRYGIDIYGEYSLAKLIRALTDKTSIPWFRILYCYPDKITDELICEFKNNSRLLKYIDLPIQHISDNMLKSMNRHGDSNLVKSTIQRLRDNVPEIVIRTTAIVGFPGETEEDFKELCDYVEQTEFDRFGAFTYSREEDTAAFDFPNQTDEQTKQDRLDRIMSIQLDIHAKLNEAKIGKTVTVLCEGFDPIAQTYYGRTEADAPDIDGKIYFSSEKKVHEGDFISVRITDAIDYDLYGTAE